MKKIEKSKLDMQKTLIQILDDHVSSWAHFELMHDDVEALRAITLGTSGDAKTQVNTDSKGFTKKKRNAYSAMVDETHQTALKMRLWAKKTEDDVLFQLVDISIWGLRDMSDLDKLHYCKAIHEKAVENLFSLAPYQVTVESNDQLNKRIIAAEARNTSKNVAGVTHKQVTGSIHTGVRTAADILDNLDTYVDLITDEKDAVFVAKYQAARKLKHYKNTPARKEAVQKKEDKA